VGNGSCHVSNKQYKIVLLTVGIEPKNTRKKCIETEFFHFVIGLGTYRGDDDWHIEAAHSNAEPHWSSASRGLRAEPIERPALAPAAGRNSKHCVQEGGRCGAAMGKKKRVRGRVRLGNEKERGGSRAIAERNIFFCHRGIVLSEQSLRGSRNRNRLGRSFLQISPLAWITPSSESLRL
jgi:hypothetical protein